MTGKSSIEEWKIERCVELARGGKVTQAQICERLGLSEPTVRRILKDAGVKAYRPPAFSWTKWLQAQYAKDRANGVKSGRRPPPIRR